MKKVIGYFFRGIIVIGIITVTILLGLKIANDTKEIEMYTEDSLNIEAESRYYIDTIEENFEKIKSKIEADVGQKVELADTGTIVDIELYFVAKVDGKFKYIISKNVDNNQKFEIVGDELGDGKFMINYTDLGLENCVFTDINKYSINKNGKVEYGK